MRHSSKCLRQPSSQKLLPGSPKKTQSTPLEKMSSWRFLWASTSFVLVFLVSFLVQILIYSPISPDALHLPVLSSSDFAPNNILQVTSFYCFYNTYTLPIWFLKDSDLFSLYYYSILFYSVGSKNWRRISGEARRCLCGQEEWDSVHGYKRWLD